MGAKALVQTLYKDREVPKTKTEIRYVDREVKVEVESEESKEYKKLLQVEKQLEKIQQEISCLDPVITAGIKVNCGSTEAALIVRYGGEIRKEVIAANIEELFPDHPCKEALVKTAATMLKTIKSTKEIRDILKWEKTVVHKTVKDKVYGIELQYKVRFLDQLKGVYGFRSNETTLLVAYKSAVYVMDAKPEDFPDEDKLAALTM